MRPRLTIVLALIVLAPLVIVGWLGVRVVGDERVVVEHRIRELATARLESVDADVQRVLADYATAVAAEMRTSDGTETAWRELGRQSALVRQFFVADGSRGLIHPPVATPVRLSSHERQALERTASIWDRGELLSAPVDEASTPAQRMQQVMSVVQADDIEPRGAWHAWYWGNGLQLMYWYRSGNRLHAAEIERVRLLAEVVAALPQTNPARTETDSRIRLLDSDGAPIYQWGPLEDDSAPVVARLPLSAPLSAWTLEYLAPADVFGGSAAGGYLLNLVAGLSLLGVTILGLTYWFYREQTRELREAAQRVTFVNQVSHELKTPLTNIRMYAELLDRRIADDDAEARNHLGVVVSESQRLSRLIGNILTFSREQREGLRLRRSPGDVDEIVASVLEHFGPAFDARGIEVSFRRGAPGRVEVDGDALEQVVGNLLSNVEKYAGNGRPVVVETAKDGETITIDVTDRGPGIPRAETERIFRPFYRVNDSLTEGVSGTGIGLAIARELCRLHGGDLELVGSESGARFRVTLRCPPAEAEA